MINEKVSQIFSEIAEMLEVLGENPFRSRAYQRASEVIRGATDLEKLRKLNENAISELPGVGEDLYKKIIEIMDTGECQMHKQLIKKLSPGILDVLHVRGIGPKKAKLFYDQLGIDTLQKLRSASEMGALCGLPGMGKKSELAILKALEQMSFSKERISYKKALKEAEEYLKYLHTCSEALQIQYAGSLRRKAKTIGDIDVLATAKDAKALMKFFLAYPKVVQILASGDTKASVLLKGNIQVDLRIVASESFGSALFYFTGPKHFNIHTRTMALKRGLKINEYGIFKGKKRLAGLTEQEMFEALNLPYLSPEQREDFK
ncbi:MAG: nucleotidyltransferase domain-containing protein [Candidatus Gracilibacteria bacterium]